MEDKVYILSDGSEEIVAPEDEAAFQAELKANKLTATLKSDESGNQTGPVIDANIGQNTTASNQEVIHPQNKQQVNTESNLEDGSSDSQQDPEDPFKTSYGGVNYNELLGLHHDEVIKKLNENKKYPGLKVEKTRAGIVELTLPNGEKRKIATGGQSPSQKQQRHSVWNAEWKAVSSESENVLKYVDDYFKNNEDNKKVLSVVGTTMDDDHTLA